MHLTRRFGLALVVLGLLLRGAVQGQSEEEPAEPSENEGGAPTGGENNSAETQNEEEPPQEGETAGTEDGEEEHPDDGGGEEHEGNNAASEETDDGGNGNPHNNNNGSGRGQGAHPSNGGGPNPPPSGPNPRPVVNPVVDPYGPFPAANYNPYQQGYYPQANGPYPNDYYPPANSHGGRSDGNFDPGRNYDDYNYNNNGNWNWGGGGSWGGGTNADLGLDGLPSVPNRFHFDPAHPNGLGRGPRPRGVAAGSFVPDNARGNLAGTVVRGGNNYAGYWGWDRVRRRFADNSYDGNAYYYYPPPQTVRGVGLNPNADYHQFGSGRNERRVLCVTPSPGTLRNGDTDLWAQNNQRGNPPMPQRRRRKRQPVPSNSNATSAPGLGDAQVICHTVPYQYGYQRGTGI